jgi:hypothetical protein
VTSLNSFHVASNEKFDVRRFTNHLDVRESMRRDTVMKVTNKMHYID